MTDAARGHSAATLYEASAPVGRACDPGLRGVWPGARVAGAAFTVRGVGGDNLALHRAVYSAPAGSVLVADLQAAAHGHWGEILAVAAQQRGILGLVVDGGVRDVAELAALGFPVFARHVAVVGTGKKHSGQFNVPVRVGGVVVGPGDLVVGDADGVVVIPAPDVDRTLEQADARVAAEQRALEAIRAGTTTLELYRLPVEPRAGGRRVNHNPFFAIADRAEELRPAGDHALDAALARLTSTLRTLTPNVRAR